MKNFVENLYHDLIEELSVYAALGTLPVRRVTGAIHSVQKAFGKLKIHIAETPFKTQDEEIHFFKYEKPRFTAEHFYAMEIFSIETARPLNDSSLLKVFYEQEIKYVTRFLDANKFLYAYYQFDLKELDYSLFIRGAKPVDIPVPDMIGPDPLFTTCCDTLWGKFMAFERLEEWLRAELKGLEGGGQDSPDKLPATLLGGPGGMRWTGETINLVEIAYGIWLTGQLNNGQVSITEIVEFLEKIFRVRIGKPHRRWQGIANRKRLGYTKFLDEMRNLIEKRIEEEIIR
ncbi:MAG TPA: RteC domain-containing protein [Mucilaginibacter sp.]|jgi:hypothetical protein|nr:RteC domain-containing protein [Mucilaginibacter sp.]